MRQNWTNCFEHTSRSVALDFFPAHSAIPHQNGEKQLSPRVRFLAVSSLFFAEDAAKVYVDSLRTKGLRHFRRLHIQKIIVIVYRVWTLENRPSGDMSS